MWVWESFGGVCMIFCNLSKSFKRLLDFGFLCLGILSGPIQYSIWEWRCRMCRMPTNGNPPWQPLTCFKIFWTSVRSRSRADIDWKYLEHLINSFVGCFLNSLQLQLLTPQVIFIYLRAGIDHHPQLNIAPPFGVTGSRWRLRQNHEQGNWVAKQLRGNVVVKFTFMIRSTGWCLAKFSCQDIPDDLWR